MQNYSFIITSSINILNMNYSQMIQTIFDNLIQTCNETNHTVATEISLYFRLWSCTLNTLQRFAMSLPISYKKIVKNLIPQQYLPVMQARAKSYTTSVLPLIHNNNTTSNHNINNINNNNKVNNPFEGLLQHILNNLTIESEFEENCYLKALFIAFISNANLYNHNITTNTAYNQHCDTHSDHAARTTTSANTKTNTHNNTVTAASITVNVASNLCQSGANNNNSAEPDSYDSNNSNTVYQMDFDADEISA